MAAYRIHQGGVWTAWTVDRRLREELQMYEAVDAHFGFRYARTIARAKFERVCDFLIEVSKGAESIDESDSIALQAFERWHAEMEVPNAWKPRALGRVYAYHLFSGHAERDRPKVRRCFINLVRHDPTWLSNPGVWSIGTEAVLGPRVASLLKWAARTGVRFDTGRTVGG
jgi:hypothetical protein